MYAISKEFHFSASHQLNHLPEGHQCARLHGHNYVVKILLWSKEVDSNGFVLDYGELTEFKNLIDSLDHRHLNDLFPEMLTTAENLAKWLAQEAIKFYGSKVNSVQVSETPKTNAEYIVPQW